MKLHKNLAFILSATLFSGIIACSEPTDKVGGTEPDPFAVVSQKLTFSVDTLYTDFENPWGMTWLPDGRMLVTERKGEILIFKDDKFTGEKLTGVPANTASAGFTLNTTSGFYFTADFQFTDKIPMNDSNANFSDSYSLLNLKTGYEFEILSAVNSNSVV